MSHQPALDLLAQDPGAQAMVVRGANTPDLAPFVKDYHEKWSLPTTPEEEAKLWERWRNPPLPVKIIYIFGGQHIPSRLFNTERIIPIDFIRGTEGWAEIPVLLSPEYTASYIFADALESLSKWFACVKVRPTRNPKGGKLLEPIGITTLLLKFPEGSKYKDILDVPFFSNFHVLNESSVERGVMAILGKPEIERLFGMTDLP